MLPFFALLILVIGYAAGRLDGGLRVRAKTLVREVYIPFGPERQFLVDGVKDARAALTLVPVRVGDQRSKKQPHLRAYLLRVHPVGKDAFMVTALYADSWILPFGSSFKWPNCK